MSSSKQRKLKPKRPDSVASSASGIVRRRRCWRTVGKETLHPIRVSDDDNGNDKESVTTSSVESIVSSPALKKRNSVLESPDFSSTTTSTFSIISPSIKKSSLKFEWRDGGVIEEIGIFKTMKGLVVSTGKLTTVTQIDLSSLSPTECRIVRSTVSQITTTTTLTHHPNNYIVTYTHPVIQSKNTITIFSEYGKTLAAVLKTFGPLDELLVKKLTSQITQGLEHLNQYYHIDCGTSLTSSNVYLQNNSIKISPIIPAILAKIDAKKSGTKNIVEEMFKVPKEK